MAELPEIAKLSGQMKDKLCGKVIHSIVLLQEKCTNVTVEELNVRTIGASIVEVYYKGKWIFTKLSNGEHLLLSLGMGADVLYFSNEEDIAKKYQLKVLLSDGTGYTARFWWFGKYLLASEEELTTEPNTKDIALDPFNPAFTIDHFISLIQSKRTQIKVLLMNQKIIGGIGNMYMHDILFKAQVHPKTKASDLSEDQIHCLYYGIQDVLNLSRQKGAFSYEMDFFGQKGSHTMEDFLVGYKEHRPCPICSEAIVLIKTGSTSTYICPSCQQE